MEEKKELEHVHCGQHVRLHVEKIILFCLTNTTSSYNGHDDKTYTSVEEYVQEKTKEFYLEYIEYQTEINAVLSENFDSVTDMTDDLFETFIEICYNFSSIFACVNRIYEDEDDGNFISDMLLEIFYDLKNVNI